MKRFQRRRLGVRTFESDASRTRIAIDHTPVASGTLDHGSLLGLSDDDHAQYIHLTANRTITAQHTISPGSAQAPIVLGANAQSQLVIGLRADQLNKQVIAGDGLTNGGTLTADVTLDINPGTGLEISGDAIIHSTGDLGDLHTNYAEHDQAETISAEWTFNADLQVNADIDLIGAQAITTTANNLTLLPAGDLILDPTGKDVLPFTNYDVNLGSMPKKYLSLHAAELVVETLVAQDTIATIGGRVLIGPTTKLTSDWTITDLMSGYNPSFETAGGGGADVFALWGEAAGSGTIVQDTASVEGSYSAKLTYVTGSAYIYSSAMTVETSTQYVVTYWVKSDGVAGRHAIYDVTNGSYIITAVSNGVTVSDWTPVTVTFTTPYTPSACVSIRIYLWSSTAAGSAWYDVVTCSKSEQTITVEHNQMGQGDIAYLEADGKVEFIGICTAASGSGPYTYTITRNLDGTGATDWYAGDAVFNLGASPYTTSQGSGFIDLYSFSGVWAGASVGPTIVGNTWPVPNAELVLNNSFELGSGTDPFDFTNWIESAGANGHITRDTTPNWGTYSCKLNRTAAGANTYVYQDFATTENTWYRFQVRTKGDGTIGASFQVADGTTGAVVRYVDHPSWGINTSTSWVKYSFFFKTIPGSDESRVLFLISDSGSAWVDAVEVRQMDYNDYREGWAIGNLDGLYGQSSTKMGIGLGVYESDKDHLLITEDGIYFKNYTATIASWEGDTITLGPTGASTERVVINSSGVEMYSNNIKVIDLDASGNVILGNLATNEANIHWNNTNNRLEFRGGTSGTDVQSYIDIDGAFVAGDAALRIDSDGLELVADTAWELNRAITFTYSSDTAAEIWANVVSGGHHLNIITPQVASQYSSITLLARSVTDTYTCSVLLRAEDASGQSEIDLYSPQTTNPGVHVNTDIYVDDRILINETVNSVQTNGITIKGLSGELFTLKSDVACDFTSAFEADTILTIKEYSSNGGVTLYGLSDLTVATQLYAFQKTADANTSTSALAAIVLRAGITDGSNGITTISSGNLLSIRNNTTTRVVVDESGVIHSDAASAFQSSAWDEYDDIALLHGFRASLMPNGHDLRKRFSHFIKDARLILESTGVVTYNDGPGEDGSIFVAHQPLQWLTIDAVRQLHDRIIQLEEKLNELVN